MKRVKLVVAYDGTNYCGWQVQPNAVTVEGVLNETLRDFLKEDITVFLTCCLFFYFSTEPTL